MRRRPSTEIYPQMTPIFADFEVWTESQSVPTLGAALAVYLRESAKSVDDSNCQRLTE